MLKKVLATLACCNILAVWQIALAGEILPTKKELAYLCKHNQHRFLRTLLNRTSQEALQLWLSTVFVDGSFPLFLVSQRGCTTIAGILLDTGAETNIAHTGNGETPLHAAVRRGYSEMVQILLDAGADPNLERSDGTSPLFTATFEGYNDLVWILLNAGADPNLVRDDGTSPLFVAVQNNFPEIVRLLLDAEAETNIAHTGNGETPLHAAVWRGYSEMVQILLDAGADPNLVRDDGTSPLFLASFSGYRKVVRMLLDAGADPNPVFNNDAIPLYTAAFSGYREVVRMLLDAGADPNRSRINSGVTPLHVAARNGHTEIVHMLLRAGADYNCTCRNSDTPLHAAALGGHPEVIHTLLRTGTDANRQRTRDGATPLHVAAQRGNLAAVYILRKFDSISSTDLLGNTPLHCAVYENQPIVVALLLRAGADPTSENNTGETVLSLADRHTRNLSLYQKAISDLLQDKKSSRLDMWMNKWLQHQNTFGMYQLLQKDLQLKNRISVTDNSDRQKTFWQNSHEPLPQVMRRDSVGEWVKISRHKGIVNTLQHNFNYLLNKFY